MTKEILYTTLPNTFKFDPSYNKLNSFKQKMKKLENKNKNKKNQMNEITFNVQQANWDFDLDINWLHNKVSQLKEDYTYLSITLEEDDYFKVIDHPKYFPSWQPNKYHVFKVPGYPIYIFNSISGNYSLKVYMEDGSCYDLSKEIKINIQ